jgi:hypothetical protein
MKTRSMHWLGLLAFLASPVWATDSPPPATSGVTPGPVAQVPSAPSLTPPALAPNAAEVVKLSGAGVGEEVIIAYVQNCQSPFNLSADAILRLKDAGVTSPVISAMLTHDSSLRNQNPPTSYAASQQPQPVAPDLVPADQAPPPVPDQVIPVAPGPDYYWIPGYWGWNSGWIWIGGRWGFRGGYGWGGRGWYGHGGWGGYHGGGGGVHVAGGYHGGGGGHSSGGFHGGGGGHGGGHGR